MAAAGYVPEFILVQTDLKKPAKISAKLIKNQNLNRIGLKRTAKIGTKTEPDRSHSCL